MHESLSGKVRRYQLSGAQRWLYPTFAVCWTMLAAAGLVHDGLTAFTIVHTVLAMAWAGLAILSKLDLARVSGDGLWRRRGFSWRFTPWAAVDDVPLLLTYDRYAVITSDGKLEHVLPIPRGDAPYLRSLWTAARSAHDGSGEQSDATVSPSS